jgi:hypothetical protein
MINDVFNKLLSSAIFFIKIYLFSSLLFFTIYAQNSPDSANYSGTQNRAFAGDTLARSPWGAVGRSFLIPGWGQWYNESGWKAPLFIVTDVSMMRIYMVKNRKVKRIEQERKQIDRQIKSDPFLSAEQKLILRSRYNNLTSGLDGALNDRNLYGWLFAISHLLGMVDAYVDAHLYHFKDKMDLAYDPEMNAVYVSWKVQW